MFRNMQRKDHGNRVIGQRPRQSGFHAASPTASASRASGRRPEALRQALAQALARNEPS